MEPQCQRRRLGRATLLAALAAVASVTPVAAREQDPATQQAEVRRERAANASKIDTLKAEQQELSGALDALDANLSSQRELAGQAARDQARAEAELAAARAAEQAAQARITQLQDDTRKAAVDAYVGGRPQGIAMLLGGDAIASLQAVVLAEVAIGSVAGTVDQLDTAREDHALARDAAQQAADRASSLRQRAESEAVRLEEAIVMHQSLAGKVDSRLDAALAEADALATLDQRLSTQIKARELALAERLRVSHAAAADAAQRAGVTIGRAGSSGDGGAGRSVSVSAAGGGLSNVGGITVAASITGNVSRLLAAASAAGFQLGGGGFRSSDSQIQVRRNNCGTSHYDIYEKPPSQCRPPAARPGNSMHERGLAIDFTCNGALITSRNACFRWLAANAGSYGLYNLPSEPWHWSTNGN